MNTLSKDGIQQLAAGFRGCANRLQPNTSAEPRWIDRCRPLALWGGAVRRAGVALVACALAAGLLPVARAGVGPNDAARLGMVDRLDPNFPVPEVGSRFMRMRFQPDPAWQEYEVWVVIAKSQLGAEADPFVPYGWPETGPQAERYVERVTVNAIGLPASASHILKHRRHGAGGDIQGAGASGYDFIRDNDPAYYRWVVRHRQHAGAPWTVETGDVHSFVMPRRLVVAVLGDSFGSGEGAPAMTGPPWVMSHEGTLGRRSPISGQNMALELFGAPTEIAFDAINLTSSGAIAEDLYSSRGQFYRPDNEPGEPGRGGVTFSQIHRLRMEAARRGYGTIDAVILSVGGNDLGFANLVGAYFGIDLPRLAAAAGIILFGSSELFGPLGGFINAMWGSIFNAINSSFDFSIRSDYPGGYPGGFQPVRFARMLDRLPGEYGKLAGALIDRPGGVAWQVNKVGVTEYPNPFKDTTSFTEFVPVARFAGLPPDLARTFPFEYQVRISPAEGVEIRDTVIPLLHSPQPPGGGFNHGLRTGVNRAASLTPDTDWRLIRTGQYQPPRTGLGATGRHFNTLRDAAFLDRGEPAKRRNHAMHPNADGHRELYRPAVLDYLLAELDVFYRRAQAAHLTPPALGERDLTGSIRVTGFDPSTRILSAELFVENRGTATAAATVVRCVMPPVGALGDVAVPSLPDKSSFRQTVQLQVPEHPLFGVHRFLCEDAFLFAPGYEFYADRDATLAFFFPRRWELSAEIDPEGLIDESSKANNRMVSPVRVEIPPTVDPAVVDTVLLQLELAIPGYGGPPLTPAMLHNRQVLEFFGYYSSYVNLFIEGIAPQAGEMVRLANNQLVPALTAAGLPVPDDFRLPARNGLRPICLFPDGDFELLASDKTTREPRRIVDGTDFSDMVAYDGRGIRVTARHPAAGGEGTVQHERVFDYPAARAGLPGAIDGELLGSLEGGAVVLPLEVPAGVEAVRVLGGTAPGSGDLFDLFFADPAALAGGLELPGFPQDGRDFHLTVQSRLGGGWESEHYRYSSPERRARLRAPEAGAPVPPELVVAWREVPSEGFRLLVGSFPGGADVFPGLPLTTERLAQATVDPGVTELAISGLPRDGRPLHFTLQTRLNGVWESERSAHRAEETGNGGLTAPTPGQPLTARNFFTVAWGTAEDITGHRLLVGTTPGGDDLYDSAMLPPTDIPGVEVELPQVDAEWLFATVVTYRGPGAEEARETYPFRRTHAAGLVAPGHGDDLPPEVIEVAWQHAREGATGYRLAVAVEGVEAPIHESFHPPFGTAATAVDLRGLGGRLAIIELETLGGGEPERERSAHWVRRADAYDYESDDLPPFWQFLHFGRDNPLAAPGIDADGDGEDNATEYLGGSLPNDPRSVFRPQAMLADFKVRFRLAAALPTTRYRIERSTNLKNWKPDLEWLPEAFEEDAIMETDLNPDNPAEFFRLRMSEHGL